MANWVGFSDEELRRLKNDSTSNTRDGRLQMNPRSARGRPTAAARGRGTPRERTNPADRNLQVSQYQTAKGSATSLPPEARLSQPPPPIALQHSKTVPTTVPHQSTRKGSTEEAKTSQAEKTTDTSQQTLEKEKSNSQLSNGENSASKKKEDENMGMVLDDKDIIIKELHNIEKFQFQQKRIEEQNKKKRELLATAISERQKKAKQEATRLIKIQKELAQLDHLLAIDVSIIRNKIEEASREYLEAQRRYEKAEKEFIDSKMDLHNKSSHKDALTEHLHMVIHQNEVRKARKLTELMEKLSMDDESDAESLSEDLSMSAPSAFILSSLQSTQEKHAMMQHKRGTSESDNSSVGSKSQGTVMKRSASDGAKQPPASPKGSGISGWISSWITGSQACDNKQNLENKPEVATSVSTETAVVTTAPTATSMNKMTEAVVATVSANTATQPTIPKEITTMQSPAQPLIDNTQNTAENCKLSSGTADKDISKQNINSSNKDQSSVEASKDSVNNTAGIDESKQIPADTASAITNSGSADTASATTSSGSADTASIVTRSGSADTASAVTISRSADTASIVTSSGSADTASIVTRSGSADTASIVTRSGSADTASAVTISGSSANPEKSDPKQKEELPAGNLPPTDLNDNKLKCKQTDQNPGKS